MKPNVKFAGKFFECVKPLDEMPSQLDFDSVFTESKGSAQPYTVPISVDTFQESPFPQNLDRNTIRIRFFVQTSFWTLSVRHVHFEPNGLDTAGCMWYSQT